MRLFGLIIVALLVTACGAADPYKGPGSSPAGSNPANGAANSPPNDSNGTSQCNPACGPGTVCDEVTRTCKPLGLRCGEVLDCVGGLSGAGSNSSAQGSSCIDKASAQAKVAYELTTECMSQAMAGDCAQACANPELPVDNSICEACSVDLCRSSIVACRSQGCPSGGCVQATAMYEIVLRHVVTSGCGFLDTCDVFVEFNVSIPDATDPGKTWTASAVTETKENTDRPLFNTTVAELNWDRLQRATALDVAVRDANWIFPNGTIGECSVSVSSEGVQLGKLVASCGDDAPEIVFDILRAGTAAQ